MIQNLGEASYYMRCRIRRNGEARELNIDHHHNAQIIAHGFEIIKVGIMPRAGGVKLVLKEGGTETPEEKVQTKGFPLKKTVGAVTGSPEEKVQTNGFPLKEIVGAVTGTEK